MCFDRMDPARCSAVAVIQPVSELLPPRNLRLDCGWPNIARPALRCATNLSVVRWLCRNGFMRVYGMRNSLRSPRPHRTGRIPVFAYCKVSASQFSVVPVLSQSKTGTTVLSCGNVSEYTFSECTFSEGRRCWSRQPDYASIRPTRFLTVGSALSWASVLRFSWVG